VIEDATYKTWLVLDGYRPVLTSIRYFFFSIVRHNSIKILLSLVTRLVAFIRRELERNIYMMQ
jgi:hypothetical protein